MKCLEKDRTRRYETANGLARDIQRLSRRRSGRGPAAERELSGEQVRPPAQGAGAGGESGAAGARGRDRGHDVGAVRSSAAGGERQAVPGETASALTVVESQKKVVESQKKEVEGSLFKAETAERLARDAEEAGRKLLYTTDMQLAPFVWRDDRTTAEQLRVLLAKHIPDSKAATEKPDLRGFEWYYYQNLLEHSSAVFSGHAAAVVDGTLTPDGQLVTLDELGQVRRWDLATQKRRCGEPPRPLRRPQHSGLGLVTQRPAGRAGRREQSARI